MDHVTLENIGAGVAVEKFEDCLADVAANIEDPNTDAKATRKIIMTFTFKPQKDRRTVPVKVEAKANLAPPEGKVTMIHVGREYGELVAFTHDLRQREMFDPTTGEVVDQDAQDDKVVSLATERNGTD